MKLVYIEWQDACSNSAWFHLEEARKWHDYHPKFIVRNIGWIMKEDKKGITLASRWNADNHNSADGRYGLLQYIPKTWIIKRKTLKI